MSTAFPGRAVTRARLTVLALVAAIAAFGLTAAAPTGASASPEASAANGDSSKAKKKAKKAKKTKTRAPITVMTRNLYLGADLGPALAAGDLQGAIKGAGEIYRELESTVWPERAIKLGREIQRAKPDLVGLQEVALWREQVPSDGGAPPISPIGTPAEDVKYDFLADLMSAIRNAGGKYRIVGVQTEFEAELPADIDDNTGTGTGPFAAMGADLDARLTMRDVILVRKGSKVKAPSNKVKSGHFETLFSAPIAGGLSTVTADRGWLSVDASYTKNKKSKKNRFRFVNTHLEAFGDPKIREAQAKELFARGGPLRTKKKVVLVGDINSGSRAKHNISKPGIGSANPDDVLAYQALRGFGMKDNGVPGGPVQSCCYKDLFDPTEVFTHTVDHVMSKPRAKQLRPAYVTGNDPSKMTPSGAWPSDHGGVVSRIRLKK